MSATIIVAPISTADHLSVIDSFGSASFLQTPAWGRVKHDWSNESIGWFDGDQLIGAGLVLYRKVPKINRYLAYLPEGPLLPWYSRGAEEFLTPLVHFAKSRRAFAIRMGPALISRRWHANTVKKAIADPALATLADTPADAVDDDALALREELGGLGWREVLVDDGFGAGQPKYNFHLPLAGRSQDDLLAGMNQLWRRNIRKAAKEGVEVSAGTREDLPEFHRIYLETAERDDFTARPLSYFEGMWDAMNQETPGRLALYLARHEGDLVAATTMVQVGTHAWYTYGASTTAKRHVRGSNAIQWRMICDALDHGADIYDLRGITATLDPDDSHVGLIQFKAGTGGDAVEYLGEWDLPIQRVLYRAFTAYMSRRA